ncbi:hypothetical protein ES703_02080 [subsurface metagenome]|nr:PDZ domain-containing protein [bacterium]
MKSFRVLITALALSVCVTGVVAARWEVDLDQLLKTTAESEQEMLISKIVSANPSWQEVSERIQGMEFPEVEIGKIYLRKTTCSDGVERSWILYVPTSYDPVHPTPLFVNLHGGVSRPEPIPDSEALEFMGDNLFKNLAEENGWLLLFPFGQEGATWWDEVGMSNINDLVRTVKREYNVDDDRVWMGGYSDGASAAFLYAMVFPTDYAAFIALSGHMGTGSLGGDLHTYAPDFYNTPIYAVTSFEDQLFPSAKMRPAVEMAREAGGDIFYREQEGEHDFSYAEEELPKIVRFLERHPRDPFPTRIIWESAVPWFGTCRWFAIDRISADPPASWHVDHNLVLTDDRITIGFRHDDTFPGPGIKVREIVEGTAAEQMGLAAGDVIIRGKKRKIKDMDDLMAYKAGLKRGDSLELTVQRDGEKLVLKGQLPLPTNYYLFKRERPSAMARVSFSANRVEIEGSRLGGFSVFVHPDMIRLERNLVINVNGEEAFNQKVEPDLEFLLQNFLANRDRKLIYVAKIEVEI